MKIWRASSNFICFFKNQEKDYVARFNKDSERNIQDLIEEVKLLNYLSSKNINIAKPILSNNNKYVEEKETAYGTFYTIVFDRVPGKHLELEELDLDGFISGEKV